MKTITTALAALTTLGLTAVGHAAIVINEIDSDTYNTPLTDGNEFIELYSTTGTTISLDGLTLALINGNGNVSYRVIDLDGLSTDSSGYFVFGTATVSQANNTSLLGVGNVLQNGADAVALYSGDFANATAATTTNLVDAVVYGTNDPVEAALLTALGETVQYDEGAVTPPSDAANLSLARVPNGDDLSPFVQSTPTPGAANAAVPEPTTLSLLALTGLALITRRRGR